MVKKIIFVFLLIKIASAETLDEVINTALVESPFLKSYIYQAQSVEGEIKKAKSLPNPELNIEFGRIYSQIDGESGFNITNFSIQQPLRLWGERKFAVSSSKLKKQAFDSFYQFQKNTLLSNIYKTFYKALSINYQIKVKKQEISTLENLYEFLQKSYQLGEITQLDVFRVEKDLNLAKVQLEKLKANYQAQLNTLSALAGKQIKSVKGNIYSFKEIKDINITNLPEIVYLKRQIESINYQIKRQKALSKPKISVGFVAGEDEVDLGKYDFGVAINSTIPVFYRRQGEIITLVNQKKMINQKIKQKELEYKAILKSIKKQIFILKNQLKKVENKVLPSISDALKLAEKSYKLRAITFLDYSTIRQQYYQTLYYKIDLALEIQNLYSDYIKIGGLR